MVDWKDAPVVQTIRGVSGGVKAVHSKVEADWFHRLDRSLVGQLREVGGKGINYADISNRVSQWWQLSRKVEVRPLGAQTFLFVLPTRSEAEMLLRQRWTIGGRDLDLEWWSPLALYASGQTSSSMKGVWLQLAGLPLHLRGKEIYRQIGEQCGGYVAVDESSADLAYVRLCVRSSEHTPSRVSVQWGSWYFSVPVWVEDGTTVKPVTPPSVAEADLRLGRKGHDSRQPNRGSPKILGVKEYLQRFGRGNVSRAS